MKIKHILQEASGLSKITTKSGKQAWVATPVRNQFQAFLNDLEATGYNIYSLGGYNKRRTSSGKWSHHAQGLAIDINPDKNPYGKKLITDMPSNISQIAAKHGLGWGGNWRSSKDAMHFSAAAREGGSIQIGRSANVYTGPAGGPVSSTQATVPSASNQSAPQSNMLTQGPPYKNNNKVAKMQTYLENLGYSVGSTGIDGKYGWRTANAVAAFKKDYGLQGDGSTWSKAETAKLNLIDKKPNLRVKPTQVNLDSNSEDNQNLVSIESLGTMRQRFVKELQDPQFLEIVLALTISEVGFTNQAAQRAFLETLMNRSLAYNKTMRAWVLGSRYYHPMNDRRIINRRLNSIRTNKELRARVMNSLRDVLAGSNDSNLALHNGSANIAVRAKKQGTVRATIGGETFYNKTNPAGDAYYGGGYSGVRNTEAKFVQQFEKAIDNENK